MNRHSLLSLGCLAAAGAWPAIVTAVETALASPYERMLKDSICGAPLHAAPELLGHCATCWAGSALLAATALLAFMAQYRASIARPVVAASNAAQRGSR